MLTYTPISSVYSRPESDVKVWFIALLCLLWLLPGLVGHDPWKPFEAESTDIVWNFIQAQHWLIPKIADTVYLDRNPLFFWVAALLAKCVPTTWLALHDSVRLTAGLLTIMTMWGVGAAARLLYGRVLSYYAVLVLIGSIGFIFWGHHASPQVLTIAAMAWLIYGLIWGHHRPLLAGVIIGSALLVIFLGGTAQENILALLLISATFFCVPWRGVHIIVIIVSTLIVAVPLGLLWPLALKQAYPEIYQVWWKSFFFKNLVFASDPLAVLISYISLLPWFCWPALPMSIWTVWHNRYDWKAAKWRMPIVFFFVLLGGLSLFEPEDYSALSLLIPLSLLAVGGLDTQRRGLASVLNWFGMMTFMLGALIVWLLWFTIHFGFPVKLAQRLGELEMMTVVTDTPLLISFAMLMTFGWIYLLTRRGNVNRWAVVHWVSGLILVWSLLMSLLLPWFDWGKTYRYVAQDLQKTVHLYGNECIDAQGVSDNVRAAFHYFVGIAIANTNQRHCNLLLLQTKVGASEPENATLLWTGARYGERRERFYLYRVQGSGHRLQ